jgi:hypothetical protein
MKQLYLGTQQHLRKIFRYIYIIYVYNSDANFVLQLDIQF